jgi:hypothetical protein
MAELDAEGLEEFRKGLEMSIKIARRFAQLGTDEFNDATEWEFMAGIMTLASWMSAGITTSALELAVLVAKDSVVHMGATPKIGLVVDGQEES